MNRNAHTDDDGESLLRLCWRCGHADRLGLLVDGANYFAALRQSLLKARRSVYILGWDIDSRMRLVGEDIPPEDGAPETLREFLNELVAKNHDLNIRLLLWDYSVLLATERELLPQLALGWRTPRRIDVCLDDELPFGASHHHKLVVIDDRLAFIGGLDLTIRRWDTPAHKAHDPRRIDPAGEQYPPFHDLHAVVDGEPAEALAEFCRDRWALVTGERPAATEGDADPWPASVEAAFEDIETGIARTIAAYRGEGEVQEVEAVYLAAIRTADQFIYIENQYLTTPVIAKALIERLEKQAELQVLIMCPRAPGGWLEARTMTAGRERIMAMLSDAGVDDRVRFAEPRVCDDDGEQPVMVHAKLMIVDDRVLLIGSANLNNRSFGLDTECNLVLDCDDEAHRKAIRSIRSSLIAEHTGAPHDEVDALFDNQSPPLDEIMALSAGGHRLSVVEAGHDYDDEISRSLTPLADPEMPVDPADFIGNHFGGRNVSLMQRRLLSIAAAFLLLGGLVALWRYSPLVQFADAEFLAGRLSASQGSAGVVALMLVLFVGGGLLFFPVTVLVTATGILLGPVLGFLTALAGSLLSAAVSFAAGMMLEGFVRTVVPRAVRRKVRATMKGRGLMSVALIRNVPVAPYTAVNLLAAQTGIGLPSFLLGTLLGMAPGIAMLCIMGDRLRAILDAPSAGNLAALLAAVIAWLAVVVILQKLANRLKK